MDSLSSDVGGQSLSENEDLQSRFVHLLGNMDSSEASISTRGDSYQQLEDSFDTYTEVTRTRTVREVEEPVDDLKSQILLLLHELDEARDLARIHEERFKELQGVLEEERLASAHQAEIFSKQIQRLQAQLRSVQEELDSLEEEKESELLEVREELRLALQEIVIQRQVAEEAAAERENDIATMQEELCRVRAKLEHLRRTTEEYELEIITLRAEIEVKKLATLEKQKEARVEREQVSQLQDKIKPLQNECQRLATECQVLQDSNERLKQQLQQLEEHQHRAERRNLFGTFDAETQYSGASETKIEIAAAEKSNVEPAPANEGKDFISPPQEGHLDDAGEPNNSLEMSILREQLQSAESTIKSVETERTELLHELKGLEQQYKNSQKEREELEAELSRCKEELQKQKESASQDPPAGWSSIMMLATTAIALVIITGITRVIAGQKNICPQH
nr:PREDICTED: coiled-coil domain-containing protein 136 [Latimeria chalumnae]|eukprot:XP_006008567.1 PREDICTED: coiled-coil domain-containing protein 136 [Latimeria chalumnae]